MQLKRIDGTVLFDISSFDLVYTVTTAHNRCVSLDHMSLPGCELNYASLNGANMSASDLRATCFFDCNLTKVNFTGADVREANFFNTDLSGANFTRANMALVSLTDADLTHAVLDDAYLGAWGCVDKFWQYPRMGSRNDYLHVFHTEKGYIFHTGCFWGEISTFEDAVTIRHGGRNGYNKIKGTYYDDYITIIREFKTTKGESQS